MSQSQQPKRKKMDCLISKEQVPPSQLESMEQVVPRNTKEEEFLALVLVMISNDKDSITQRKKKKGTSYISRTCDEHRWKHAMCPPECPNRIVEEIPSWVDEDDTLMDTDSGCEDDEEGLSTNGFSSSEEFPNDRTSPNSRRRTRESKRALNGRDTTNYSNARRGYKRKNGNTLFEDSPLRKKKYQRQKKIIKGIQMHWNPMSESYGLPRPKSSSDYLLISKWAMLQLSKKTGTLSDVFAVIKKFGWSELTSGNLREELLCKTLVGRTMENDKEFTSLLVNDGGEKVFTIRESETMQNGERSFCGNHPRGCPEDCPLKVDEIGINGRRIRESRRRAVLVTDETSEDWWSGSEDSFVKSPKSKKTNRKKTEKGRRWVRFACEKHRREHARCPDNCPLRKESYSDEETNSIDAMDTETFYPRLHQDAFAAI